MDFAIPYFHKSIVVPCGDIFLTGGRLPSGEKSDKIFKFDFNQKTLIHVGTLAVPRSSHGICYVEGHIFVIGGFTNNQKMTASVEKFNVLTNQTTTPAPLNFAASSLCATGFNGNWVLKVGGIGENR